MNDTHELFTPSDINTALTALSVAGLHATYDARLGLVLATMEYPDHETGGVYTEEVPCSSLESVYDLIGQ